MAFKECRRAPIRNVSTTSSWGSRTKSPCDYSWPSRTDSRALNHPETIHPKGQITPFSNIFSCFLFTSKRIQPIYSLITISILYNNHVCVQLYMSTYCTYIWTQPNRELDRLRRPIQSLRTQFNSIR